LNLIRLHLLPFVDHGQHFNEMVGFDLVEDPVGMEAYFAYGVFVELGHPAAFSPQFIQVDGQFG